MQKHFSLKHVALLLGILLSTLWQGAYAISTMDGVSNIFIKDNNVQGSPKGSTIQAYIDGHTLTVVFTENSGQVTIEVTTATGATVDYLSMLTPNGYLYYITNTGDYIVTFTLPNGDEYYGEFTVTD